MDNLEVALTKAVDLKPKFGKACNSCGYCCMMEVCAVGVTLTGSDSVPCQMLISNGDRHTCKLAEVAELRQVLAIGTGCDAKTQAEVIEELLESQ